MRSASSGRRAGAGIAALAAGWALVACTAGAAGAQEAGQEAEQEAGQAAEQAAEPTVAQEVGLRPSLTDVRLVNGVIAAVDAFPITLRDLREFERTKAMLLPPEDRANDDAMLDTMVRGHMFKAEFQEKGIVAADSDVELYIDNVLVQSGSTREELETALSEVGLTWDDYYERMREEVQRLALINREIRTRVNVSPEEIERYWKEHEEFDLPERVVLSDIFIPVGRSGSPMEYQAARRLAEQAYELAKEDGFEAAARAYSRGPTAADGGRLGEFAAGSMAPEFDEAIGGLAEGEFSTPFTVGSAYHIVRLDGRLSGGRVPLEKIEDEIREQLYAQQLDERFRRWVEEDLVDRHHVVIQLHEIQALAAGGA